MNVKLLGIFRGISGRSELSIELKGDETVREVIQKIAEELPVEFKRVIIDPELNDPRPNALILLNGRDISVLEGLKTRVKNSDEITLIPVSHGG